MAHFKAELHSDYTSKTVEFKSDKTGLALVREAKKQLNCTGYKMQLTSYCGNFKQWSSPNFTMTLTGN